LDPISNPDLSPLTDQVRLAPGADGQNFVRCGTLGSETGWQVALAPDARRLAALTSAGTVRLFQTTPYWSEIAQLASPVGALDAIAFSPDGARLATLSSERGAVTLWNSADGAVAARFDEVALSTLNHALNALAFSSDGRRLATSLGTVIDLATGTTTSWDRHSSDVSVNSLRFVGCDQRLVVDAVVGRGMSGSDREVLLVDVTKGVTMLLAGGRYPRVRGTVTSSDGRWIAIALDGAAEDATQGLRLFDAATGTLVASDATTTGDLIGFSPASDRLYTTIAGEIEVRDVPALRPRARLMPPSPARAVGVSPRGEIIASAPDTSAWLDPGTGAVLRRSLFQIARPTFSADGRYGVSSGAGAMFRLWGEADATARCAPPTPTLQKAVAGVAVSPDGKTLATVDGRGIAELRAIDDAGTFGRAWNTIDVGISPNSVHTALAVANGGARVAARGLPAASAPSLQANAQSRVIVVDVASGRTPVSRDVARTDVGFALSPDGAWVAFDDGPTEARTLSAVAVDTGAPALFLRDGAIRTVDSFSPDSKRLALAAPAGMEIWDLAAGTLATTYAIADKHLRNYALSPNWSSMGGIVISSPFDLDHYMATVWRPSDGYALRSFGTRMDFDSPPRFDPTAAIMAASMFVVHTSEGDWHAWHVWFVANGVQLRQFTPSNDVNEPLVAFARGNRLLTRAGSALAVWCRI